MFLIVLWAGDKFDDPQQLENALTRSLRKNPSCLLHSFTQGIADIKLSADAQQKKEAMTAQEKDQLKNVRSPLRDVAQTLSSQVCLLDQGAVDFVKQQLQDWGRESFDAFEVGEYLSGNVLQHIVAQGYA